MLLEKDELLRPEKVVIALAGIAGVDASRLDVMGMERVSRDGEGDANLGTEVLLALRAHTHTHTHTCLLYTSPSPRDVEETRMPSSA